MSTEDEELAPYLEAISRGGFGQSLRELAVAAKAAADEERAEERSEFAERMQQMEFQRAEDAGRITNLRQDVERVREDLRTEKQTSYALVKDIERLRVERAEVKRLGINEIARLRAELAEKDDAFEVDDRVMDRLNRTIRELRAEVSQVESDAVRRALEDAAERVDAQAKREAAASSLIRDQWAYAAARLRHQAAEIRRCVRAATLASPAHEHGIGCSHVHTYLGENCPGTPAHEGDAPDAEDR
jgi:hypothetical protein